MDCYMLQIFLGKRISHPSEVPKKVGQKITVKLIKYNNETQRLSLGIKQLHDDHGELMKNLKWVIHIKG